MTRALLAALAILTAAAPAAAAAGDVTGIWMRDDGSAKIRFAPCGGEAVCGFLAWKKNPGGPAKVGQELFFGMKPNGPNSWAGSAFNPEDGKHYSGKMTLSGDRLVTAGCVLGGLICKSFDWTRAR
ncbi:MAG TPA: DUF2147 domain-containing protein [Roseiarcus sp.]|jgi:uncharacterized protein (DUF2147 family)